MPSTLGSPGRGRQSGELRNQSGTWGPTGTLAPGPAGELPRRSGVPLVPGHPGRDLGPGIHVELAPDVLDVRFGGPRRDRQAGGGGLVGEPLGDEFGHLELALSELGLLARPFGQKIDHRLRYGPPVTVVE